MNRKLTAVIIGLALVATSCGGDDDAAEPDTPAADEPAADEPAADEPAADEPAAEEPAGDEPAADEPAADDGAGPASGEPIKIGSIGSISGPVTFADATLGAQLVIDRYNAAGGLDGRPIELVSVDDQGTVEGAAAAAKQLFEDEGVLGFASGGSTVDCTTNAGYYEENGIYPIMAVGACAEAATVSPVNTGPFLPTLQTLDFFVNDLGKENVCFTGSNVGPTPLFVDVFLPMWEQASGKQVNIVLTEVGEDLTPAVSKLAADGCDAVMSTGNEFEFQTLFQAVAAQGLRDEITWGMLSGGYSITLLDAAGENLEGVFSAAEFEPYTGDPAGFSDDVKDFLSLMDEAGETPTGFAQGGYLAAQVMIAALESIDGDITFDSVQDAIQNISYDTPMLCQPFEAIGFVGGQQPNPCSQIVQVQDGEFVPYDGIWRTFTPAG